MPSRRSVLASSVALTTAVAGCSALGGDSGDGSDGRGDDPLAWLPAPESGSESGRPPSFVAFDVDRIGTLDERFEAYDPERMPPLQYRSDPVGIDRSALDYVVRTGWSFGQAVRGAFDRSAIEAGLDEDGSYESAESTAGFSLYAGGEIDVAVGDDHVCWSAPTLDDGIDSSLPRAVAAKTGDGPRAVDENDRLSSLSDRLGTGLEYGGEAAAEGTLDSALPGPLVAFGGRLVLDGEDLQSERHLVYESAADVPAGDTRDGLLVDLAETMAPLSAGDLTAETDGDALVVSGTYGVSAWIDAV